MHWVSGPSVFCRAHPVVYVKILQEFTLGTGQPWGVGRSMGVGEWSMEERNVQCVTGVLADDHRRLEQLLDSAVASAGPVNQGIYDQFRAGLLRHIGIEEKILLPAAQRLNGGQPLSLAPKLRLDHGAIVSLLMPSPTARLVTTLRRLLAAHNILEEGPGGLYELCDRLAGSDIEPLLEHIKTAPDVAVLPHSDTPAVHGAVSRALDRAGYPYPTEWSA